MNMTAEMILNELLERYPTLIPIRPSIESVYARLVTCFTKGHKLLICGNGGSAADSLHIVGELMKSFTLPRPIPPALRERLLTLYGSEAESLVQNLEMPLPAIALVENVSLSTALDNDTVSGLSFAQQVLGLGEEGDVLLCISTSGNAGNVRMAAMVAKSKGMDTILLSGASGGKLRDLCDFSILVPETETFKIQELHLPVYHCLCRMLESRLFRREQRGGLDK